MIRTILFELRKKKILREGAGGGGGEKGDKKEKNKTKRRRKRGREFRSRSGVTGGRRGLTFESDVLRG